MRVSTKRCLVLAAAVACLGIWSSAARAYPTYRNTADPGVDDCQSCHGAFSASPYQRCQGGTNHGALCTAASECPGGTCLSWGHCDGGSNNGVACSATSECPSGACARSLHDVHRASMLGAIPSSGSDTFRCDICHSGSSKTPVVINQSNGILTCASGTNAGANCKADSQCPGGTCSTVLYDPIACVGCHGRQEDRGTVPTDCVDSQSTGPCGDGAGLRQHHQRAGITVCSGCHSDAVPANFTPVGESVLPPYYFTPDAAHPLKPTNSCNPNGEEDFDGTTEGLDNDGNLLYDLADPNCPTPTPTVTPTPTETATPTVTETPTPVATPNKDSSKCQAAIVKNAAAFVQARTKALQKCEDGVVKHKLAGPCPDQKASDSIAKAQAKLAGGIAKACGGKDKTCGSGGDDVPLGVVGWSGPCPDLEGKGCSNAIDDCNGIATCVSCIGDVAVDQAIGLYYDALQPTDPKSKDKREKALNKCQAVIGKAGATFLAAQSKALQKCWDGKNKGKINDCPDVKAGDGISKAAVKLTKSINGACGGKDKQPGGDGDNADFTPMEIGFPATCMDVDFPGFITSCSGAVTDLQSLVGCVTCVTRFKAGCADRAGALGLGTYPSECNVE